MAEAQDALINKANVITITDKLGEIYAAILPILTTATTGCQALSNDIFEDVMAITDENEYYVVKDLLDPCKTLVDTLASANVMQLVAQSFLTSLNQHFSQRGSTESSTIRSVDTFASYWNATTFTDVLFSPDFRALYYAVMGSNLSAGNCYSPAIEQGATYANAMGKWDYDSGSLTFTAGQAVDTTNYMGARPSLKVTTQLECTAGQTMTITVTGTGYDETGQLTETTWTKTAVATLAAGDYDFAESDDRFIQEVTDISIAVSGGGSMSAGVCYVEGTVPSRS